MSQKACFPIHTVIYIHRSSYDYHSVLDKSFGFMVSNLCTHLFTFDPAVCNFHQISNMDLKFNFIWILKGESSVLIIIKDHLFEIEMLIQLFIHCFVQLTNRMILSWRKIILSKNYKGYGFFVKSTSLFIKGGSFCFFLAGLLTFLIISL